MAKPALPTPCLRLRNLLKGGEDDDEEESEIAGSSAHRMSMAKIQRLKSNISSFVVRLLLVKILQHVVTGAYFVFMARSPKVFANVTPSLVLIPLVVWALVFMWVHNVKKAPTLSVSVFFVISTGLCLGYVMGEIYRRIHSYALFLPATLLCLVANNILFLPFFIFRSLRLNMKRAYFHLVPQLLNLLLNLFLTVIWSGLIHGGSVDISKKGLDMRNKNDAVLLMAVPTLFWSFSLTLLMSSRIKAVVEGQMFNVSRFRRDYVFAALYFI